MPPIYEGSDEDVEKTISEIKKRSEDVKEISEKVKSFFPILDKTKVAIDKLGKYREFAKMKESEFKGVIKYPSPTVISLIELKSEKENIDQRYFLGLQKFFNPKKVFDSIPLNKGNKWSVKGKKATALFRGAIKSRACSLLIQPFNKEGCNAKSVILTWHNDKNVKEDLIEFPEQSDKEFRIDLEPRWFREVRFTVNSTWGNSEDVCIPKFDLFDEYFVNV